VERDDIGVVQPSEGTGFAGEAFGESGVSPGVWRKNFQRHDPVELFLTGFIDGTHAAATNQFDDFQLRKLGSQTFNGRRIKLGLWRMRSGIVFIAGLEKEGRT